MTVNSNEAEAPAPALPAGGAGEMCRLTICGPTSRVELAVPAHVPIADLMPTVLGHLDPSLATTGLGHGGWVLQRLGEAPLDEEHGTAAAGLYDGDILHLRPRDDQLPVADFDDLVDGVHTGLTARGDTWTPALTRRVCLGLAGVCGLLAVLVTAGSAAGLVSVVSAAVVGVVLLGGAAALDRLLDDAGAAVTLGASGVLACGVAGLALPSGGASPALWFTGPGVLAASVAVAVAAGVVYATLSMARPGFMAVAVGGVLTAAACVLDVVLGLGGPATAAVLVTVVLGMTRFAPQVAAWLAGLVAEPVPTTPEGFQQGLDPLPGREVLDKATVANQYLTAFTLVLGAVGTGALLVVSSHPRWDTLTLACAVSVLLLLQSRELNGAWHRAATLVPGVATLVSVLLRWTVGLPLFGQLGVAIGLLALAGNAVAGGQVLPGRQLVPKWGRWGDILHWLCGLSVLPVVLSITGFYQLVASWL
ncbi:type VII secretion integral membrane protein EccD [Actinophytocola xanthii]|nr:type VII secretion integral membrane protein EccD [Actinophytocola xanthii]